jgi:hypothetical protein
MNTQPKLAYYSHPESSSAFIDTDPLEGSDGLVEWIGEAGPGGPSPGDFIRAARAQGMHDYQTWLVKIDFTKVISPPDHQVPER